MNGYVSKPIRTIELFSAIESVMQERSTLGFDEPPSDQRTHLDEPLPHENLNTKT